jgi:hypothetical protein
LPDDLNVHFVNIKWSIWGMFYHLKKFP